MNRPATTLGLVAAITVLCCAAESTAGGMTPKQLSELRMMTEVAISPDGARIAAIRRVPRRLFEDENGSAWGELVLIDADSGQTRPFVTGEVTLSKIAWLPGGGSISFRAQRNDDDHLCLYRIPTDGGEATRILDLGSEIKSYAWSPDGTRVAAIAERPKTDAEEALEDHGFDQQVYEEDWRPLQVWVAELGAERAVPRLLALDGSAHQLRWAPDGERLAVALAPNPSVDDRYMSQRVHVVRVDTGEIEAEVEHSGKLGRIEWSPDGARLAMIAGVDLHDPAESSLLVAPAQGGVPRNLTPDFAGDVQTLQWQDPEHLLFLADVGVQTEIFRVSADAAGAPVAIGRLGDGAVFTKLSVADDGRTAALLGEAATHPGEVFTVEIGSEAPRRLTDSNPWLADIELADQEVVRYRARDGLELEGLLIYPLGYRAGTRYPLVLTVHGGPEAHYRNGWLTRYSRPGQIFAARGFAVFYPNYRGSTGRGVEFSLTSQAEPAGAEFDDLVDAVDHLSKIGLVDRDRVGITGGSYGGYATAWCATRYSDRFAAGVMFVGISNKISKLGTTDIPREELLVHARKLAYDDFEFFLSRSPIAHVAGARTPLLILHGKDDPRVSVTQSREMYRAIKMKTETPVRLVLYPGEEHGNSRAAARYDYMLRSLRWMEHFLKGRGESPPPYHLEYRQPEHGWPPADQ
jgi:dipeptidyl aminopeptidase/acylaminoacyl peptidase